MPDPTPRNHRPGVPGLPDSTAGAAARQRTCAVCGGGFVPGERTEVEVLHDGAVRYVAVHPGHSTYARARESTVADRLRRITHRAA